MWVRIYAVLHVIFLLIKGLHPHQSWVKLSAIYETDVPIPRCSAVFMNDPWQKWQLSEYKEFDGHQKHMLIMSVPRFVDTAVGSGCILHRFATCPDTNYGEAIYIPGIPQMIHREVNLWWLKPCIMLWCHNLNSPRNLPERELSSWLTHRCMMCWRILLLNVHCKKVTPRGDENLLKVVLCQYLCLSDFLPYEYKNTENSIQIQAGGKQYMSIFIEKVKLKIKKQTKKLWHAEDFILYH